MALKHHTLAAVIALATLSAPPVWAAEDTLQPMQQNGLNFVTGGIGEEQTDALKATEKNYNLRITNSDKSGHFAGDNRVVVRDTDYNVLIDAESGPLFYADLPKGKYIVEGYSGIQRKEKIVNIRQGKTSRVHFLWPEDLTYAGR